MLSHDLKNLAAAIAMKPEPDAKWLERVADQLESLAEDAKALELSQMPPSLQVPA